MGVWVWDIGCGSVGVGVMYVPGEMPIYIKRNRHRVYIMHVANLHTFRSL